MSDMLEQAIIDADALKEAATKNAETLVLEKYSNHDLAESVSFELKYLGLDIKEIPTLKHLTK